MCQLVAKGTIWNSGLYIDIRISVVEKQKHKLQLHLVFHLDLDFIIYFIIFCMYPLCNPFDPEQVTENVKQHPS